MKEKNPLVVGYRHTGIITRDIEESLNFYRNILGFELIQDFEESGNYISTITGLNGATAHFYKLRAEDGTVIELLEYPSHPTKPFDLPIINVGICHIALRVNNSKEAYERLLSENIKVLSEPVKSSCGTAKVFFCLDPDNVRVEIVEMLNE
jgi:catechol 2,3-dioxygenase-like lactoylglutathione lyase family enzyme